MQGGIWSSPSLSASAAPSAPLTAAILALVFIKVRDRWILVLAPKSTNQPDINHNETPYQQDQESPWCSYQEEHRSGSSCRVRTGDCVYSGELIFPRRPPRSPLPRQRLPRWILPAQRCS